MATFTEQLAAARRTAQISGRPITKQEVSGIAAGAAESASVRLARSKGLELEEERIETTKTLQTERLEAGVTAAEKLATERAGVRATSLRLFEEEKEEQETKERAAAVGAVAGGVVGGIFGGVGGAQVGAIAGSQIAPHDPLLRAVVGSSFICTATKNEAGLYAEDVEALARFKLYAKQNHGLLLDYYLEIGPEITRAIADQEKDLSAFYLEIKKTMIQPVIVNMESSHGEQACKIYMDRVGRLIKKYTPHLLERWQEVVRNDKIKFKEAA